MMFQVVISLVYQNSEGMRENQMSMIFEIRKGGTLARKAAVKVARAWINNRCEAFNGPQQPQHSPGAIKLCQWWPGVPQADGYINQATSFPFYEWKVDSGTTRGRALEER